MEFYIGRIDFLAGRGEGFGFFFWKLESFDGFVGKFK
jgi:hypothetical protein